MNQNVHQPTGGYEQEFATPPVVDAPALNRRLLTISAVLGLIGAILLGLYLRRFELEMSGGERVELITPLVPIARGEIIKADMLGTIEVPAAYVEPRAVKAAERTKVIGIKAATALEPQITLLWTDLALGNEDRDLSSLIQPGNRAVTVQANQSGKDPNGNGLIRPGDYVDVIATLFPNDVGQGKGISSSVVLLQRVLVLAVGTETQPQAISTMQNSGPGAERSGQTALTLSLRLKEAQLLSLATQRGSISVALRNPGDEKVLEGVPDIESPGLFDTALREEVQRSRTAPPRRGNVAPIRLTEQGAR